MKKGIFLQIFTKPVEDRPTLFLKLFKEWALEALEQEILRRYLNPSKENKLIEEHYKMSKELDKNILKKLSAKGLNTEFFLDGLASVKPLTYWDYIQTESLLNLQTQRTDLPDEMVFIIYHQINELLFKMILWEMEQLANKEN